MDLFEAIKGRRSCRRFLAEPVDQGTLEKILEAAVWAPSPLNMQPWEFVVVTNPEIKEKIFSEADRCREWALEKSGWKWLGKYAVDFLKSAPVLVVVVGDPKKSGVDTLQKEGNVGYQHACAAAIQNMHLAAHALGLSSLWFTFFDRKNVREILGIDPEMFPVGLVCIGKPDGQPPDIPRKDFRDRTRYLS
ncbi:MAG: nitroreductase family protein [Deltaproteobacteria bacterium]|nr:nitroreductase family protein [Deltaproteobacteria bacterium]